MVSNAAVFSVPDWAAPKPVTANGRSILSPECRSRAAGRSRGLGRLRDIVIIECVVAGAAGERVAAAAAEQPVGAVAAGDHVVPRAAIDPERPVMLVRAVEGEAGRGLQAEDRHRLAEPTKTSRVLTLKWLGVPAGPGISTTTSTLVTLPPRTSGEPTLP